MTYLYTLRKDVAKRDLARGHPQPVRGIWLERKKKKEKDATQTKKKKLKLRPFRKKQKQKQ